MTSDLVDSCHSSADSGPTILGREKRGDKRDSLPPPRAEQKRRRRGAGQGLGRTSSASGLGPIPAHADDRQQRASPASHSAEGDWFKPWERRPDWEYLPHLDDRGGGAPTAGAQIALGDMALHSPRRVEGALGHRECSIADATSADAGAGEIRGRDLPPGTRGQAVDSTEIRGQRHLPGPTAEAGVARAQERLNAKNVHLARSLADHAERVNRRSIAGDRPVGPSAAARLEALRRRVAERLGAKANMETQERGEAVHGGAAEVAAERSGKLVGDDGARECDGETGRTSTSSRIVDTNRRSGGAAAEGLGSMRRAAASSGTCGNAESVAKDSGNRCLGDECELGAGVRDSIEEYKIHQGAEVEAHGRGARPSTLATVDTATAAAAAADAWHACERPRAADGVDRLSAR